MMNKAMQFSRLGDQHFDQLAARFSDNNKLRLAFEHRLNPERYEQIRHAAAGYISACLQSKRTILSEGQLIEQLMTRKESIPNYALNGLLVPKKEHVVEFNLFHRSVAAAFTDFKLDDLVDTIDLPLNVRMVYGKADSSRTSLPYSSSKLHSDAWFGVPADAVVVILPLFGDIDNITVEFGEMPQDQELANMRVLRDFDEGKSIPMVVPYSHVQMRHGSIYFSDTRMLHKTVRRKTEGVRLSVDFRFRMTGTQTYREMVPADERVQGADFSIPYAQWLKVGTDRLMAFDETAEEGQKRHRTAQVSPDYSTEYRFVDLTQTK